MVFASKPPKVSAPHCPVANAHVTASIWAGMAASTLWNCPVTFVLISPVLAARCPSARDQTGWGQGGLMQWV
jgi:hypothetical protein